jgi:predicted RNA binding protein YcfA (HicA-like mRNA interferase family)
MSTKTDVKRILKRLQAKGFKVKRTKSSHVCVTTPQGPVFCSSTPSDHRAIQNILSMLKRKGVDL